jgi:hypothetical protein
MISMMPLHTTLSGQLLIFFLYAGTQGGNTQMQESSQTREEKSPTSTGKYIAVSPDAP